MAAPLRLCSTPTTSANNVLTRGYRNGTVATSTYNANNWVCSLNHTSGANLIVGFTYAYDNEGNKFYEQKLHETNDSEAYTYDPVYRLIDYQAGMLASLASARLSHKPGRRTDARNPDGLQPGQAGQLEQQETRMGSSRRARHSPSNEITTIDSDADSERLRRQHQQRWRQSYSYDEENRLVQGGRKPAGHVLGQYQYDAFGRRVSKIDNFGVQTFYYYDGWRTIEEQSSVGRDPGDLCLRQLSGRSADDGSRRARPTTITRTRCGRLMPSPIAAGDGVEGYYYDAYGYQTFVLPGPDGILDFDSDDDYTCPERKAPTAIRFRLPASATIPRTVCCITRSLQFRHFSAGS